MKKIILALSIFTASSLLATKSSNRIEIDVSAGINKFDDSSRLSNNASLYGIRATMYETEVDQYGFQLAYEGVTGVDYDRLTSIDESTSTDLYRVYANMVVDGIKEYGILPYVILGVGYEYLSDEIKGETSQGIADLAIGFKYELNKSFNVAFEVKGIGKFDTNDIDYMSTFVFGYTLNQVNEQITAVDKKSEPKLLQETIVNEVIIPAEQINDVSTSYETETSYVDNTVYPDEVQSRESVVNDMPYSSGNYYVQLAAFDISPVNSLVNRARAIGYNNTFVHVRDNTNLILVGPYHSKRDAKIELVKLKKIAHDAFVMKMK